MKCDREPTLAAVGFAVAAADDDDDDSSCLIGTYVDLPKIVQCDKNGEEMDWYGMVCMCAMDVQVPSVSLLAPSAC